MNFNILIPDRIYIESGSLTRRIIISKNCFAVIFFYFCLVEASETALFSLEIRNYSTRYHEVGRKLNDSVCFSIGVANFFLEISECNQMYQMMYYHLRNYPSLQRNLQEKKNHRFRSIPFRHTLPVDSLV